MFGLSSVYPVRGKRGTYGFRTFISSLGRELEAGEIPKCGVNKPWISEPEVGRQAPGLVPRLSFSPPYPGFAGASGRLKAQQSWPDPVYLWVHPSYTCRRIWLCLTRAVSSRGSCDCFPILLCFLGGGPLCAAVSLNTLNSHGNSRPNLPNILTMDTERLLKIAREYFDHEYAPYVGGASLLAGAVAWFYATDINRALMVGLVP